MLIGSTFGPDARYLTEDMVGKNAKAQRRALARFAEPDGRNTAYCAGVLEGLGSAILPQSLAPLLVLAGLDEARSGEGPTVSGLGSFDSAPFSLEGGMYPAQVENTGSAPWNAFLIDAADALDMRDPITESDLLEEVEPGDCYWSVESGDCEWSVRLLPEKE